MATDFPGKPLHFLVNFLVRMNANVTQNTIKESHHEYGHKSEEQLESEPETAALARDSSMHSVD